MIVTRFNPTVNGPLHLGHLYMALVNWTEARRNGGRFIVRFDDTQEYWQWRCGEGRVSEYRRKMHEDLEWAGLFPDLWSSQLEDCARMVDLAARVGYPPIAEPFADLDDHAETVPPGVVYPYHESLTAEKVLYDFLDGVTWIIRGEDLLTEDCLYRYFVQRFRLPRMRITYIPRLQFAGDCVSKTEGNFKLASYRAAGIAPQEVIDRLAVDCLVDPGRAWTVDNLKAQPTLGTWATEVLTDAVHG